jgi:hypothetical protein
MRTATWQELATTAAVANDPAQFQKRQFANSSQQLASKKTAQRNGQVENRRLQ